MINNFVGRYKVSTPLTCIDLLFDKLTIPLVEYFVARIEWEELTIGR